MSIRINEKLFDLQEVEEQKIDKDVILYCASNKRIYSLNETATVVWKEIYNSKERIITIDYIIGKIVEIYNNTDEEEVKQDIESVINEFILGGLLNEK